MGNQASSQESRQLQDRHFSVIAGQVTPIVGTPNSDSGGDGDRVVDWVALGGVAKPPTNISGTLNLSRCKWTDADLVVFASRLHEWPNVTELALGFNSIGDDGIIALVEAIVKRGALQRMERLYLAGNNIGERGVDAIVKALRAKALPVCTYINLAKNPDAEECVWLVEELLKGQDGYVDN